MKMNKLLLSSLLLLLFGCNPNKKSKKPKTFKGVVLTEENVTNLQSDEAVVLTKDTALVESKIICFSHSNCTDLFDTVSDNEGYVDSTYTMFVPGVNVQRIDTTFVKPVDLNVAKPEEISKQLNTLIFVFLKKFYSGLKTEECIKWENLFLNNLGAINLDDALLLIEDREYKVMYDLDFQSSTCIPLNSLTISYQRLKNDLHLYEFTDGEFVLKMNVEDSDFLSDQGDKLGWIKFMKENGIKK